MTSWMDSLTTAQCPSEQALGVLASISDIPLT
jgi:hypothetical protein